MEAVVAELTNKASRSGGRLNSEASDTASVALFPVLVRANAAHKPSDEFVEAVVIAQITRAQATAKYPLGRLRYNKLAYLAKRKADHDVTQQYIKKAAGPYSPWAQYGGPEKIAIKKEYVKRAKAGKLEGWVAGEKIGEIDNYILNYPICSAVSWAVERLGRRTNDGLELLATVDFAALDLRGDGKAISSPSIKQVIADNKEWAPKLDRAIFSDENIETALRELAQLFPVTYSR